MHVAVFIFTYVTILEHRWLPRSYWTAYTLQLHKYNTPANFLEIHDDKVGGRRQGQKRGKYVRNQCSSGTLRGRCVVIVYKRFGTMYRPYLQGSRIPSTIPEEHRSYRHRGGSLKSSWIHTKSVNEAIFKLRFNAVPTYRWDALHSLQEKSLIPVPIVSKYLPLNKPYTSAYNIGI
jgi:hypothetical protein